VGRRTATKVLAIVVAAVATVAAACSGDDDDGGSAGSSTTSTTGASTTTAAPRAGGELLLLSYNVAGLPQEISDVNPEAHLPLISPRLEPYDVVLTQEDFDWWTPQVEELAPDFVNYHERLRAETTHEYATEQHPGPEAVGLDEEGRDPPFVGDGLGILSRIPFDDVDRVPWEGCFGGIDTSDGGAGDCLSMKGFAVATFTVDEDVEIDVYTIHAEAGSTEEDIRLRARNYDQLSAFMEERSAGRAVIIAGDMNLHLEPDHRRRDVDEPVWLEFLEAAGLTDVCDVVECDDPGAIDKAAFRSDGGVEIEPLEQRFAVDDFLDDEGVDLSDHPPLEVRFAWTAA
jgi:hypothetical protein